MIDEHADYEIKIKGHLDIQWADWFGDLALSYDEYGDTLLSGTIEDQAALHGVLTKIRDLGLHLLAVNRIDSGRTTGGK